MQQTLLKILLYQNLMSYQLKKLNTIRKNKYIKIHNI